MFGIGTSGGRSIWRDRRGLAVIETAFVLPPFLTVMVMIVGVGIYFTLQSALDAGVLATAESLRSSMMLGTFTTSQISSTALKSAIASNGGAVMQVANLAVDVRQLSTRSAGSVAIVDGTNEYGASSSGSILVVRAQSTLPFLPWVPALTIVSTSVIRRPPY